MNLLFADNRSEEMSLMQLVERDEMDEDDDLFEAIDKCKIDFLLSCFVCVAILFFDFCSLLSNLF